MIIIVLVRCGWLDERKMRLYVTTCCRWSLCLQKHILSAGRETLFHSRWLFFFLPQTSSVTRGSETRIRQSGGKYSAWFYLVPTQWHSTFSYYLIFSLVNLCVYCGLLWHLDAIFFAFGLCGASLVPQVWPISSKMAAPMISSSVCLMKASGGWKVLTYYCSGMNIAA